MAIASKDRIRRIHHILPQLDCRQCGYGNCGRFARAVAEGKASPFGCRQDPSAGYRISEILRQKAPQPTHTLLSPIFYQRSRPLSLSPLREELCALYAKADDILARIEVLARH